MANAIEIKSTKAAIRAANREKLTRDALANFDVLPDEAILRVHAVAALRGCSVPTVWRHASQKLIAAPVKLGGVTGWRVGDLRKAVAK